MGENFNVGGVMLDRPFRIRRLGHFMFNFINIHEAYKFYIDLLGFSITDTVDMSGRLTSEVAASLDDLNMYLSRYGSDHHAFIFSSKNLAEARGRGAPPKVTVGQLTWQVGSLDEVVNGEEWFRSQQMKIQKSGRDTPGSNWHTYTLDPWGHPNEIYYGIEQIGWNGYSKPKELWRGFLETPERPQIPEYQEVQEAIDKGVDLCSGYRHQETREFSYATDGILMARPFKITSIGPVRFMVPDMEEALEFYCGKLGFQTTEEVMWDGHRCVFLRINTDHHALALYPEEIGPALGLSDHSYCMSFGVQLYSYEQLQNAIRFLEESGVTIRYLPPELTPGMDYTAFAVDPDGHLVQLYYYMEQIGWDGRPRPQDRRRPIDHSNWPETLDATSDVFGGQTYLGPWA